MKLFKLIMLFLAGSFMISSAAGQANASLNILAGNGGLINLGGTQNLQITVNNTGPTSSIGAYKVRVQISVPTAIANIAATQTGLPTGWTITSQTAGGLFLSNGTDVIPVGGARDIFIAINGIALGGPSTITGALSFSNGIAPGTGFGTLSGDNPSDNSSTTAITVQPAPACAIAVSASAGTIACNGGTTTLTATATGATGAVEYSLNGGTFQAGNTFTVNAAGSPYTVTAREVATPTCTANSAPVTVTQPTAVAANAVVTTPIATIGGTGAITVSATGGTGTKTYVITSGTTVNTTGANSGLFTGLLAGTYTFTAADANGCTGISAPVALNDPAPCTIAVTASAGTIACNGGTTTLTAIATGAAGTVEYSLNGSAFQSGNTFTVNAAGSPYTVTAREVSTPACTANSAPVAVAQPAAVAATAVVTTPIAIPGGTGEITVSATGGTGAKTFVITSGATINTTGATSGAFTGLLAGSYTFTATDANGCTGTATIVLANPGIATADPAVGQMYFTTTSGAIQNANSLFFAPAADVYDINIPFYNLNQLNQVPNGTIRFTVNIGSKLVLAPGFNLATAPLNAFFAWSQAVESGNVVITGTQIAAIPADFDGIAVFRVKGDSACRSNVVSNIVITNQLQTLNDDDLQNNSATLQYTLPITLSKTQVNVTCNGAGNGIINITASSGTTVVTTGPAGYSNTQSLASGQNTFPLTGLFAGVYTITATATSDPGLGSCSQVTTVTILQPTLLTIANNPASNTNNGCFGASSGSITVTAAGGTAPYTYTIVRTSPSALTPANTTGELSGIFTGLPAGTYTVTSTDNNGCTASVTGILITQPGIGVPDITLGSDISSSFFPTPGTTQTIVYNIAEIGGNSAVGDTLRITKVAGFTINFNPFIFSTVVGGTTYALDNTRWKIDNTNPAFVSIILTDPNNALNPGTLLCNQLVRVAVTLTRNTSNISTFPVSARLRQANGETVLSNNFNSIIMTAD